MTALAKFHSPYNYRVRIKEDGEDLTMPSGRAPESQIVSVEENILSEKKQFIIKFSNDEDMELYKYFFGKYLTNSKFEIEFSINHSGNLTQVMTMNLKGCSLSSLNIIDLDYTKSNYSQTRCCFDITHMEMK